MDRGEGIVDQRHFSGAIGLPFVLTISKGEREHWLMLRLLCLLHWHTFSETWLHSAPLPYYPPLRTLMLVDQQLSSDGHNQGPRAQDS